MTASGAALIDRYCEVMHDAYERAAVGAGWETNPESRKPWSDVPEANKATMRAAVVALLEVIHPVPLRKLPADYDSTWELTEEARRALPPEYHQPVWMDLTRPESWICAQCWGEDTLTSWPCAVAEQHGKAVAKAGGLQVSE